MPQISPQYFQVQRINPTAKATTASRGVPFANAMPTQSGSTELASKVAKAMSARAAVRDDPGLYDRRGRMDTEKSARKGPAEVDKPTTVRGGDTFTVSIQESGSAYANRLVWSNDGFKTMRHIGVDNEDVGVERSFTVARGKKVEFGILSGDGNLYRAGAAARNADGIDHARITRNGDEMTISFEDLWGGGDLDFDDAVLRVRGLGTKGEDLPEPGPAPAIDAAPSNKTNRSGLGDGSNPGQGAGRTNSPNEGTLNPGEAEGKPRTAANTRPSREAEDEAARAGAERNRRLLDAMYGPRVQAAEPKDEPRKIDTAREMRKPELEAPSRKKNEAGPSENAKNAKEAQDRKAKEAAEARKAKEADDVKAARKAREAEQALQAKGAEAKTNEAKRQQSEAPEATRNAQTTAVPHQDNAPAKAEAAKRAEDQANERSSDERKARNGR